MENMNSGEYMKLAKKFLAGKPRKNYYEVLATDENCQTWRFLQELGSDTVKELRALREKYGNEGFVGHLDEVFTNIDEVHDLSGGCEIVDINLDKPLYQYYFARHEMEDDGSLHRAVSLVELSDEEYIRLVAYCLQDKGMNINKLRYADKALHATIVKEVDYYLCDDDFYIGARPYLITMDEIKEDVASILAQHPELSQDDSVTGYLFA